MKRDEWILEKMNEQNQSHSPCIGSLAIDINLHSIEFILRGSIPYQFYFRSQFSRSLRLPLSRSLYHLMRAKLAVIMDQLLSLTETVIIYRRCLCPCIVTVVCCLCVYKFICIHPGSINSNSVSRIRQIVDWRCRSKETIDNINSISQIKIPFHSNGRTNKRFDGWMDGWLAGWLPGRQWQ